MVDVRSFTLFDWFLTAVLVYSTVAAFMRGFFREVFSLVGLVAGILLAGWNYPVVAARLAHWLPLSGAAANVIAFLAIALVVMIGCGLVGRVLKATVSTIGLGFLDRLLGATFGLVRGCLLGVAILMAAAAFVPDTAYLRTSALSSYFLAGAHAVCFVVPTPLQERVRAGALELKHRSPDWIKPTLRVENQ